VSYDIEVFTADLPCLRESDSEALFGKGWQIALDGPHEVEPEDIPEEVSSCLPGLSYLVRLHLEPGSAPKTARQLVIRTARKIAREANGVLFDQQTDAIETPRGVKRFVAPPPASKKHLPVSLGWHFLDTELFRRKGFEKLLSVMTQLFPEALPRRYGHWEPPQHKLKVEGISHFTEFTEAAGFNIVWYPYKPVQDVGLGIPEPVGPHPLGFRTGHLKITISGSVFLEPRWRVQMSRFFLRVCSILLPFYGEIRLGSALPQSWWWNGVPKPRGRVTVIGPPYTDLWPEFIASGVTTDEGLCLIDELGAGTSFSGSNAPEVPESIAEPEFPSVRFDPKTGDILSYTIGGVSDKYPAVWPFDGPTKSRLRFKPSHKDT